MTWETKGEGGLNTKISVSASGTPQQFQLTLLGDTTCTSSGLTTLLGFQECTVPLGPGCWSPRILKKCQFYSKANNHFVVLQRFSDIYLQTTSSFPRKKEEVLTAKLYHCNKQLLHLSDVTLERLFPESIKDQLGLWLIGLRLLPSSSSIIFQGLRVLFWVLCISLLMREQRERE